MLLCGGMSLPTASWTKKVETETIVASRADAAVLEQEAGQLFQDVKAIPECSGCLQRTTGTRQYQVLSDLHVEELHREEAHHNPDC